MTKKFFLNWLMPLFQVLPWISIGSLFDDDSNNLVSKEGLRVLVNNEKMEKIRKQIHDSELENRHSEVLIK